MVIGLLDFGSVASRFKQDSSKMITPEVEPRGIFVLMRIILCYIVSMQPEIIFEDKDIVIINKPSGLITHPRNPNDSEPSVVSWFVEHYPESAKTVDDFVGDDEDIDYQNYAKLRPGIVHRLDKETSGILVLAKNKVSLQYLKTQFQEHSIEKTYIALVHGVLDRSRGTINAPILSLGSKMTTHMTEDQQKTAKHAATDYEVKKTYGDIFSLVEVKPQTGRTHQIRVHMKSIGHPIVGDPLYSEKRYPNPENLRRLFLHARSIAISLPSGSRIHAEADLPQELGLFLETFNPIA